MFGNKVANRPYTVQKQFVFRGMVFKTGDTFDPTKAQCPPAKLRILLQQRLLDVSSVPTKEMREVPSPQKAPAEVQTPAQGEENAENANSDADSTEPDGDAPAEVQTPDEAPKEEAPHPRRRRA